MTRSKRRVERSESMLERAARLVSVVAALRPQRGQLFPEWRGLDIAVELGDTRRHLRSMLELVDDKAVVEVSARTIYDDLLTIRIKGDQADVSFAPTDGQPIEATWELPIPVSPEQIRESLWAMIISAAEPGTKLANRMFPDASFSRTYDLMGMLIEISDLESAIAVERRSGDEDRVPEMQARRKLLQNTIAGD